MPKGLGKSFVTDAEEFLSSFGRGGSFYAEPEGCHFSKRSNFKKDFDKLAKCRRLVIVSIYRKKGKPMFEPNELKGWIVEYCENGYIWRTVAKFDTAREAESWIADHPEIAEQYEVQASPIIG